METAEPEIPLFALQRHNSKRYCDKHAEDGECPYIQEACLDVVLDIDLRETCTEQGSRNHGADEGSAVTADNHSDSDRQSVDAECLADSDNDGKHAIEVGVCIECQCQRNGQDTGYR